MSEKSTFKKSRGIKRIAVLAVLAVIVFYVVWQIISQFTFTTTFYKLKSDKLGNGFRVVELADLHLKEYGKDNSWLIAKVESLAPDIIVGAGDMNINTNPDYSKVISLFSRLTSVAPVYYGLGNHEIDVMGGCDIVKDLEEAGVTVLSNQSKLITVNGDKVNIFGFNGKDDGYRYNTKKPYEEYSSSHHGVFKLMICHYPSVFLNLLPEEEIDLALSGHVHGGIINIPFKGGMYSTEEGFWPSLYEGYHRIGKTNLVISRGLGSSNRIPRINNQPEIVVVDMEAK